MTEKTMRDWPSHQSHFTLPMRYLLQGQGPGTVILLHGYQDHALSMTKRMGWLNADLPFQILSINAPFPVPIWKDDSFIEAYSWYFRDTSRDIMIVHPSTTAERVAELTQKIVPASQPLALLGFSQGGYLAAFAARFLPLTKAIVVVGSGYPAEAYAELRKDVRVFGLHGEQDERWPLQSSRLAHQRLVQSGFKGEFHAVPGLDHRVDPVLDPLVRRMVMESFGASL